MNRISYKFKNERKWQHLTFDKSYLTVLEVKRGIVAQKKLQQSHTDFDLLLTNAQTGEGEFYRTKEKEMTKDLE